MTMMRWDPFGEVLSLRQVMDRLLEDAVIQPGRALRGAEGQTMLLLDLAEHDNELVVKASLPGIKPEDVHITVEENVLTIEGELREEPEQQSEPAAAPSEPVAAAPAGQPGPQGGVQAKKPRYHHRERPIGHFFREVMLPVAVDAGKAGATFEHGLLTITLPKAQAARRRHIAIKGAGQGQQLPAGGPSQAPGASPSAGTKAAT
jgi:HSP20 family protein